MLLGADTAGDLFLGAACDHTHCDLQEDLGAQDRADLCAMLVLPERSGKGACPKAGQPGTHRATGPGLDPGGEGFWSRWVGVDALHVAVTPAAGPRSSGGFQPCNLPAH